MSRPFRRPSVSETPAGQPPRDDDSGLDPRQTMGGGEAQAAEDAQDPKASPDAKEPPRAASRDLGALRALRPFLAPYRGLVLGAGLALMVTATVSLMMPIAVRRVVDGFETESARLLDSYFLAALAIAALLALGTGARYYLVTRLGERVVADIRKAVFNRTLGQSPAFFDRIMTGEVLSRITTDTTLIQSVIGSSVSVALRNVLMLIGGVGMLLLTSAKLTALVLLLVPLIIVPIVTLGRRLRTLSRDNQDWIAASSGAASEALLSVQTVQAFTAEAATREQFSQVTERSFDAARARIGVRAVMTMIVIALVFGGIVGVLWIGARDVRAGTMSVGELVQFVIYAVLVAGSTGALTEIWGELTRAAGASERLAELLKTEDSVTDPETPQALPQPTRGAIAFEGVRFNYPARPDTPALDGVDFAVEPGETVALVGPSGAGKSTILQLLLRFYDPAEGRITLDGMGIADVTRQDLRGAMALVPQDPVIFASSVAENIAFGTPNATREQIEAAARAAHADEFIARLPQGYDTEVGERGVMLSGGQKQRLAIARALLRDAPVMLLDEATSALDAGSEAAVQQAIEALSAGRTTLVIAHRLATVKRADRILVFDQGRVVAQGTHDSLVAEGGLYARLARLQFTAGAAE